MKSYLKKKNGLAVDLTSGVEKRQLMVSYTDGNCGRLVVLGINCVSYDCYLVLFYDCKGSFNGYKWVLSPKMDEHLPLDLVDYINWILIELVTQIM